MSYLENGGPAFPCGEISSTWSNGEKESSEIGFGMTLRDYFAAAALKPLVENATKGHSSYGNEIEIAQRAYEIANAMLEARKK